MLPDYNEPLKQIVIKINQISLRHKRFTESFSLKKIKNRISAYKKMHKTVKNGLVHF